MGGGGGKGGGGGSSSDSNAQMMEMYNSQMASMQEQQLATSKALADTQTKVAADKAEAERVAAENVITQAKESRDSLYSTYLDVSNSAHSAVNDEISKEQSNADLLGIDYAITDDQKKDRAANYLSSMWTSDQQSQLNKLIETHGTPADFKGFDLARKDGAAAPAKAAAAAAAPATSMISKPIKASESGTILSSDEDEDEDVLGG